MDVSIRTPETHPDHHTVGMCFASWDGNFYFCDSYDPSQGYWMTRCDAPEDRRQDKYTGFRKNVSERAIARTMYTIRRDHVGYYSQFGPVDSAKLGPYAGVGRYADDMCLPT